MTISGKGLVCVLLLVLFTACTQRQVITIVPEPTSEMPQFTQSLEEKQTLPTATPSSLKYVENELWLEITSPLDAEETDQPSINVEGSAPEGTVVSINEVTLVVSDSGTFSLPVELEEGPNLIEVLASNKNGDEIFLTLAVFFNQE